MPVPLTNVASFVDRDMYIRYVGGGIGHYHVDTSSDPHEASEPVENDSFPSSAPIEDSDSEDEGDPYSSGPESEQSDDDGDRDDFYGDDLLGPEDGEGEFFDEEDEAGYGAL